VQKAQVRALCLTVASDMHPLHTTRITSYLRDKLHLDQGSVDSWIAHWINRGLAALEAAMGENLFCVGDAVTLADVLVVPELYAARRSGIDVTSFHRLLAVEEQCNALAAFKKAHPATQPDAV
jgi:maleylacetoacetate isomerase